MANQERLRDRGTRIANEQLRRLGREAKDARIRVGKSQRSVAASVWVDGSWVSRFERGEAEGISVDTVSRILAVLGLDLSLRAFPSEDKVRDEAHASLIGRLVDHLPASIGCALEVPFPSLGDKRAWDMRLRIGPSAWGVEAETHVRDFQATCRNVHLKQRDGMVDGVILLIAESRHHRTLLRDHAAVIRAAFPVDGRDALAALKEGRPPQGDAVIIL